MMMGMLHSAALRQHAARNGTMPRAEGSSAAATHNTIHAVTERTTFISAYAPSVTNEVLPPSFIILPRY